MKKRNKNILIAPLLESYFKNGLINERNASPCTISSYSYTFHLLLKYSKKILKKDLYEITLTELNATFIRDYLMYLENNRHIKPQSRNQQLAAIKSFFRYISPQVPMMAATIGQVLAIQTKKTSQKPVHSLTIEEVNSLLACQNLETWIGRRDHYLILFAIETGFRLSEIISLTWRDIRIVENYGYVRCVGKGRKEREVILSKRMSKILKNWERETAPRSITGFIFPNIYGESMSPDTVQALLKKYAQEAKKHCPSLESKRISPHTLRHTTAMNLRNAGADLLTIASMLGHKSIETTQIYFEADNKRQEETLNLLVPNKTKVGRFKPKDDLEDLLQRLRLKKKTV
jgi:site-specific recombinase XerD